MRCTGKSTTLVTIGSYGGNWCVCGDHVANVLAIGARPDSLHLRVRQRALKEDDGILMTARAEHEKRRVCQWDPEIHGK